MTSETTTNQQQSSSNQTYRVIGAHAVLGVKPGGRIQAADVPSDQLARLVARGSLQVVTTTSKAVADGGKEKD